MGGQLVVIIIHIVYSCDTELKPPCRKVYLHEGSAKFAHVQSHQFQFGQRGGALRGINHEQKGAVQHLFESNSWPWNVEVTDVCKA